MVRICWEVNKFNEWKDWSDTPTGDRYQRDAVANVQSIIDSLPPGLKKAGVDSIHSYCDNSADLLDRVQKPGPGTPPAIPQSQQNVASVDRSRQPEPPPPNNNPPVATGGRGPGYGAFKGQGYPSVASTDNPPPPMPPIPIEVSTGFTGSEPEPKPEPPPPPPPPPPQAPARPAVASEGNGCWYVIGKGYNWGPRPSGGESTGLNQQDCQNLQARYLDVRNLPQTTGQQGATVSNIQNQQQSTPTNATNLKPVATGSGDQGCMPPNFWDGRQCRGSVASIPNLPGGFGSAATTPSGINPGEIPGGGSEGLTAFGMQGRIQRFPVVNI